GRRDRQVALQPVERNRQLVGQVRLDGVLDHGPALLGDAGGVAGELPGRQRPHARNSRLRAMSDLTPFEEAVVAVLGSLGPGDVVTYGEVAAEAGYPGRAAPSAASWP